MNTLTYEAIGHYAVFYLTHNKETTLPKPAIKPVAIISNVKEKIHNKANELEHFVQNREKHTASLTTLRDGSAYNLLSIKTTFPFVMFTDTLKIDRQKLTIVHNDLFWSSHTVSIRLRDIRNVQADIGPLFGSITITSKHFLNNTQTINYLRRNDTIRAQRLLQGFMIAHEAKIDTDNIELKELNQMLYKLGCENQ